MTIRCPSEEVLIIIWQIVIPAAVGVLALVIGLFLGFIYRKKTAEAVLGAAEIQAENIKEEAHREASAKKKEILLEAKEESIKTRNEIEKEVKERRAEVQKHEKRLIQKEETLDKKSNSFEKKKNNCKKRLSSWTKKMPRRPRCY